MYVCVNGALMHERDAVVPLFDHGFLYGIGLFETFRTYAGRPFLLGRHLERLAAGCEAAGIRYEPDEARTRASIREMLAANGWREAYIRLSVSAGVRPLGLPDGDYEAPNEWITGKPLPAWPDGRDDAPPPVRPLRLLRTRRNTPEGPVRFKAFPFLNNWLAKRELRDLAGTDGSTSAAEGLMLDERGCVAEGIVSNVFWVRNSRLYTPDLSTGILPGITRSVVLDLARNEGIETVEGRFPWTDLAGAEEVFVTNSVQELVSVDRLADPDGREFPVPRHGADAPVTCRLRGAYKRLIEAECSG